MYGTAALTSLFVNAGVRFKTQATRAEREAHGHGLGPALGHGQGQGLGQGLGPAQGHGLGLGAVHGQGQGLGLGLGDDSMMNVDDFYDVAMAAAAVATDANNNNNNSSNNNNNNSSSGGTGQPATNPTSQSNTNAPLQPQSSQSQHQPSQRPLSQSSQWLSGPSSTTHTPIPPIITDHFSCPPSASGSRNRLLHQWEQRRELMATNERIHLMEVPPLLIAHPLTLLPPFDTPSFLTYPLQLPLSHSLIYTLGHFLLSGRTDVLPGGCCCRRHQQHPRPTPTPPSAPGPCHLVNSLWYRGGGGGGGGGGYRQCQWHRIIVVFLLGPVSHPPSSSGLASRPACCHPSDGTRARGRVRHRNNHILLSTSHLQSTDPPPSLNHLDRGRVGGGGGGGRACSCDAQPRCSDRHCETGAVVVGEV